MKFKFLKKLSEWLKAKATEIEQVEKLCWQTEKEFREYFAANAKQHGATFYFSTSISI